MDDPGVGALVGAWRVWRATLHIGHGAWICAVRFPRLDTAAQASTVSWWSARLLALLDVRIDACGTALPGPVLCVANHVSWLDIVVLNAVAPSRFVAKDDIRRWPVLGWMAACGGTLFIARTRRRDARRVGQSIAAALQQGDRVALFPEGTTTDGATLLHFHAGLLQPAIATGAPVQPIALRYLDGRGALSRRAAFIGDMTLVASLWRVATARDLCAELRVLPVVGDADEDRHRVAHAARQAIDAALRQD